MNPPCLRRSVLFVPGSRPERFAKAVGAGADIACLDLEDAVPPADKAAARSHVLAALAALERRCELAVRVNTLRSRDGLEDLLALAASATPPDLILLPKAEAAAEVGIVRALFAGARQSPQVAPMVESLAGLAAADALAAAPGVALLVLGSADLGAEMGIGMDWESMLYARHRVVTAAKSAGVEPMDGAWIAMQDPDGLAAETRRAAALGFTGKLCIHPQQVAVVHRALLPSAAEVDAARALLAAGAAAGGGAFRHEGRMIDGPVLVAAQRRVAAWDREHGTTP